MSIEDRPYLPRRLPRVHTISDSSVGFGQEINRTWRSEYPSGFEFTAHLPTVVGSVPYSERDAFDALINTGAEAIDVDLHVQESDAIVERLPTTFAAIDSDGKASGLDVGLSTFSIYRKITDQGNFPLDKSAREWHIDRDYFYLITNREPTEFYEGKAAMMDRTIKLLSTSNPVAAEPYDIIRMMPLTVHRSPLFTQKGDRTTLQILMAY